MIRRVLLGRLLVTAGAVGALSSLVGTGLGLVVLGDLDRSLASSVEVTADAVEALAATVEVADELVGEVAGTLTNAALAARASAGGVEASVEVVEGAADVTGQDVAASLAAVEDALPALVDVASVIDTTLGGLDRLPVGPTYDPDVPFDDAVRRVQRELDGLPEALRAEAELLREGAVELGDVGRSARFLAEDLEALSGDLRDTREVLDQVAATAEEATRVLDEDVGGLTGGLTAARVLLGIGGLAIAVGQLVPLGAGWLLLRPERLDALLGAVPGRASPAPSPGRDQSP